MFALIVYWIFQIINGLSSLSLVLNPKRFHESTFKNPEKVYQSLGFSDTALEMLHNVLRGQGAALLSISIYLLILGSSNPNSMILIGITCLLSGAVHIGTLQHHRKNQLVRQSLGGSLKSIYVLIGINMMVSIGAFAAWYL